MRRPSYCNGAILLAAGALAGCNPIAATEYTLYRNSPFDKAMRIHVASFDTADGDAYNQENCQIAADLFQSQPGVVVKYWCEKGDYLK